MIFDGPDTRERVFLGFVPSTHQIKAVTKIQHKLYGHLPVSVRDSVTWVPPLSFAMVVRHLGTVTAEYMDLLRQKVEELLPERPFILEPQGVQPLFTQEGRPVLFYLSFRETTGALEKLETGVERFLSETGFPFTPAEKRLGILLARVPQDMEEGILSYIESFRPQLPRPFMFRRLALGTITDYQKGIEPIHIFEFGGDDGKEEQEQG